MNQELGIRKKIRKSGGFTLIELLIVVAIIGIFAALLMANFIGVRQRARDGQRKSDLRQIQSALELYRSDIGSYPLTLAFPSCGDPLTSGGSTYMQKIPCDPLGEAYQYSGSSTVYCLRTCLENTNDSQRDSPDNPSITGCPLENCTTGWSFTLQNP